MSRNCFQPGIAVVILALLLPTAALAEEPADSPLHAEAAQMLEGL